MFYEGVGPCIRGEVHLECGQIYISMVLVPPWASRHDFVEMYQQLKYELTQEFGCAS